MFDWEALSLSELGKHQNVPLNFSFAPFQPKFAITRSPADFYQLQTARGTIWSTHCVKVCPLVLLSGCERFTFSSFERQVNYRVRNYGLVSRFFTSRFVLCAGGEFFKNFAPKLGKKVVGADFSLTLWQPINPAPKPGSCAIVHTPLLKRRSAGNLRNRLIFRKVLFKKKEIQD